MIQAILLVLLSALSTVFAVLFIDQKKKNIQILAQTLEFLILQEAEAEKNKTEKEQFNEDFLKFISELMLLRYFDSAFNSLMSKLICSIDLE